MAEIDWTKPNREADAWIAEHVFGESVPPEIGDEDRWQNEDGTWTIEVSDVDDEGNWTRSWTQWQWPPCYTHSIAAAWDVVTHLCDCGLMIDLELTHKNRVCIITREDETTIRSFWSTRDAATMPLAICQAAYKALQGAPE